MQAVKKLETGPSVAELRRRNLIEMYVTVYCCTFRHYCTWLTC
jgi:hypothetical protein